MSIFFRFTLYSQGSLKGAPLSHFSQNSTRYCVLRRLAVLPERGNSNIKQFIPPNGNQYHNRRVDSLTLVSLRHRGIKKPIIYKNSPCLQKHLFSLIFLPLSNMCSGNIYLYPVRPFLIPSSTGIWKRRNISVELVRT